MHFNEKVDLFIKTSLSDFVFLLDGKYLGYPKWMLDRISKGLEDTLKMLHTIKSALHADMLRMNEYNRV